MEKYFKVKPNDFKNTDIKVRLTYNLGGMNYFTYKNEPRGYYVSVTPVRVEDRGNYKTESWTSDRAGFRVFLKEVKRKSAKAEKEAIAMAENMMDELIYNACERYNLILA